MSTRMPITTHVGARPESGAHRMPRRLSPRRTKSIFGVRMTPRAHEGIVGGFSIAAFIVTVFDFDGDPTVWTPTIAQLFGF